MISLKEAVIVEGKYDKIKLSGIIDGTIIVTGGFSIFKDEEKKSYIHSLAMEKGIIIMTDSDSAGQIIRNHLRSFIPSDRIKNVYVPGIKGKERRKKTASKEGTLGVEGLSEEIILQAMEKAGIKEGERSSRGLTISDLFRMGLSGGEGSKKKKQELLKKLSLPSVMSSKALLDHLNSCSEESFKEAMEAIEDHD